MQPLRAGPQSGGGRGGGGPAEGPPSRRRGRWPAPGWPRARRPATARLPSPRVRGAVQRITPTMEGGGATEPSQRKSGRLPQCPNRPVIGPKLSGSLMPADLPGCQGLKPIGPPDEGLTQETFSRPQGGPDGEGRVRVLLIPEHFTTVTLNSRERTRTTHAQISPQQTALARTLPTNWRGPTRMKANDGSLAPSRAGRPSTGIARG